jgi:hypothetical protein
MAETLTVDAMGTGTEQAWGFRQVLSAPGTGSWVKLPGDCARIALTLTPGSSGTGYVETTTDSEAMVDAGTAAGVAWPYGTVAAVTADVLEPVTALRLVAVANSVTLTGRAS